jgi:hypothetical protein
VSNLSSPVWTFREVPSGTKNRNPVQDEFFNSSEALTEISSLIRESIQNSLDAHESENASPVLLKFTLANASSSIATKYFTGLQKHIDLGIPGISLSLAEEKCDFLIVEDFNTTGLLGDSRKDQLTEHDTPSKNSYHYFVWAEGSSAKTEGNRGRWGIGKIVFPRLSNIKTFFVLSKRESKSAPCGKDELLIGMSTLRGHALEGKNYQPDGWWADYADKNSVPIPVDAKFVSAFKRDWGIKRTSESGLTILIPFIPSFISKELIRDCIIRDYFIAIIQGLLEVEISDADNTFKLTKDNLRRECENLGAEDRIANSKTRDEMLCLIDMVVDAGKNSSSAFELKIFKEFPNKWNSLTLSPADADSAVNLLDSGQTVFCRVNAVVPFKQDEDGVDYFDVYIRRVPDTRASAVFSREGIVIPSANPALIRDHLVLVIANSGPLANLLADAEGPAHEKWSEKTDKFRRNYPLTRGGQLLTFIRKAPSELLFKIRGSGTERDSTAFSSFFPLPGTQNLGTEGKAPKKKGLGEQPDKPVLIDIPRTPQIFLVDESPNGFSIKSSSDNPNLIGKRIYTKVAYRVRNGDAFSKWQREDFELNLKKPRLDGCMVRAVEGNQVILEITGRKFKAIWGGFDPLRDLDVKADLTELEVIS